MNRLSLSRFFQKLLNFLKFTLIPSLVNGIKL